MWLVHRAGVQEDHVACKKSREKHAKMTNFLASGRMQGGFQVGSKVGFAAVRFGFGIGGLRGEVGCKLPQVKTGGQFHYG